MRALVRALTRAVARATSDGATGNVGQVREETQPSQALDLPAQLAAALRPQLVPGEVRRVGIGRDWVERIAAVVVDPAQRRELLVRRERGRRRTWAMTSR